MLHNSKIGFRDYYLFIGTYASRENDGIFVYRFESSTGMASWVSATAGIENPSWLALSADNRFLYAVSEKSGPAGGSVYAYAFEHSSGQLKYLNHESSGGDEPCYISIDHSGHWALAANFKSGSFSLLSIEKNGELGKIKQIIRHEGRSVNQKEQASAHVHCVLASPDNHFILATDLGMDKIFSYRFDAGRGHISEEDALITEIKPGTGPRHLLFSNDGKFLYLIQELGGSITVFEFNFGKLVELQTISTVPKAFDGKIWASEICFSPDGRFLYASNRDDLNDLVTYSVNLKTGRLSYINRDPSPGKTLRSFIVGPNGRFLLAGHRNGDEIIIFERDRDTGKVTPKKHGLPVARAVCFKMFPV